MLASGVNVGFPSEVLLRFILGLKVFQHLAMIQGSKYEISDDKMCGWRCN